MGDFFPKNTSLIITESSDKTMAHFKNNDQRKRALADHQGSFSG
jgi:hypothetical protein